MFDRHTLLLAVVVGMVAGGPSRGAAPPARPLFPPLPNEEAWRRLPRERLPLPAWARALAGSLPRTTTAMLELDHLHRAKSPLGPLLCGKLRWVAADANGCDYAKRYAEADLRRAGLGEDALKALADAASWRQGDRAVLAFARKLTLAASTVTDEEVADLIKQHGPARVVAIVHTLAYANFQDRILLALGVEVEPGGPLVPLDVRLDRQARQTSALTPRWPWQGLPGRKAPQVKDRMDWPGQRFSDLQSALDRQKARKGRISPPDLTGRALPADTKARTSRIVWSAVSMGYQPELTKAWFDCMGTFQQEAKLDRVFANTLFWVITRSNECFY
jgi:alkylhydroperoxidase family enzyme